KTLAELTGGSVALPSTTTSTTRAISPLVTAPPPTTASTTAPVSAAWTPVTENLAGTPSECGNVSLVSAHPDRDMVITSVAQHGLWAGENGASSWTPLGTGPGSAKIINRGSTIVYDPDHQDTFWESGIYNAGGVYRTDDNGTTFRQLGDVVHS